MQSKTMPYRGLGSGIPRVMAENCDVELIDRPDGNQFIARIWRTTQKDIFTTQKEEKTTQKNKQTTLRSLTATQKAILNYLKEHSTATRQEVAAAEIFEEGGVREYLVTEHILTKPIGSLKRALDEINVRVTVVGVPD